MNSTSNSNSDRKSSSDKSETNMFFKTPEHSFYKMRKLISSTNDPQCRSSANDGPLRKTASPKASREKTALCMPKQEVDRSPPCTEAVLKDDVMIGGSTYNKANSGLPMNSTNILYGSDYTTGTCLIKIEGDPGTNGSTSLRTLQLDGDSSSERALAATPSEHVTAARSLLVRTNSTTTNATHHRVMARLTSFSDTTVGRRNGSEQHTGTAGGLEPNSAQISQDDIDRRKGICPNEPDCFSTNMTEFLVLDAGEGNSQKSRKEVEAKSISTRTEDGERTTTQRLALADAPRCTERSNTGQASKETTTSRAQFVAWPTAGCVSATNTGSMSNVLPTPSGAAPDEVCCKEQTKQVSSGYAGLANAARITKVKREGQTTLREIRGCDVSGDERALLGDDANIATPRLLGKISEHKGVLYQRIPWEGCIQVSSTGMNRATTEPRRPGVATHDGSKEINITIPVAAPSSESRWTPDGRRLERGFDSISRGLPYAEVGKSGDGDDRYSWMLDTCERVGLQHNYSSKAVVMLSMPTNGGTESASTRSGPASQSAVVHSSANGQSAPNRSANVGNRASTSDKNARGGSTCAGPARGWRRGNLDNDDNAGDIPDRPPRKQRERWQTGRRAGGGCTPKRSPRLLLKTYLQGDKGDNHSDDYVYQPLRRGDENRGGVGAGGGTGSHARCKARHRTTSATATSAAAVEEAAAAAATNRIFFDESTPLKCGLGGGFGAEDLLAVMTRSKSKTPVRTGAVSHSMFDVLPDPSPRKRKHGGTELLRDTRLGKHACLLWSSEQRRRFQQEHANAAGEELDAIMRRYWELLPDKDKLRYYQRARNAVSDRFRGSTVTHRQGSRDVGSRTATERFDSTERFHHLPVAQQYRVLKDMLIALQRRLTAPDYRNFIRNYMTSFRRTAEHLYRRQRHSKHSGGALRTTGANELWQRQMSAVPRRMLYSCVKEAQKNGGQARRCKRATVRRQTEALYRALVADLIEGRPVSFPSAAAADDEGAPTTDSAMLGETLASLADIDADERARDRSAGGDTNSTGTGTAPTEAAGAERRRRVDAIEAGLRCGSLAGFTRMHLGGPTSVDVPEIANTYYEKRVLNDSRTGRLAPLTSRDVDAFFCASAATAADPTSDCAPVPVGVADVVLARVKAALYRAVSGLDGCCALGDPSCMLNDLLVLETVRRRDVECRFQRLLRHYDESDEGGSAARQY